MCKIQPRECDNILPYYLIIWIYLSKHWYKTWLLCASCLTIVWRRTVGHFVLFLLTIHGISTCVWSTWLSFRWWIILRQIVNCHGNRPVLGGSMHRAKWNDSPGHNISVSLSSQVHHINFSPSSYLCSWGSGRSQLLDFTFCCPHQKSKIWVWKFSSRSLPHYRSSGWGENDNKTTAHCTQTDAHNAHSFLSVTVFV